MYFCIAKAVFSFEKIGKIGTKKEIKNLNMPTTIVNLTHMLLGFFYFFLSGKFNF